MKGRKRHLLVDTLGLLWGLVVGPANEQDKAGARRLAAQAAPALPRLRRVWADGGYESEALAADLHAAYGWTLEVVQPPTGPGRRGFQVVPKRWVVERTLGWLVRQRRLRIDYEGTLDAPATFIQLAMTGLMLRRLAAVHDP